MPRDRDRCGSRLDVQNRRLGRRYHRCGHFLIDLHHAEKVQRGLHTLRKSKAGLTLGIYQHTQVRHFHKIYEPYLGL